MSNLRVSLLLSFAEKYTTLVIQIAANIILARLLTPTETGLYSVASGIVGIAQTLRDFGIGNYVLQEEDLSRSRQAAALGIALALGCVMAGLFAGASGWMAVFFDEPRLQTVVLILCPTFILVAFASIGQARLYRAMNFDAALRVSIAATSVHATTSVVMAYLGYGAVGMAWASVLSITTSVVGYGIYHPDVLLVLPSFKEWRRVFNFGIFASGGFLLQEISQRLPDIVVGRLLGFGPAGLYSRGNGLVSLFELSFMNVISPVASSALAHLKRSDANMSDPFLKMLGLTTAVAWPLLGMMGLLAEPMIHLAFGDQWLPSVPVAQILCFGAALWIPGRLSMSMFTATGRVRLLLAVQLVAVPIQAATLILGARFGIEQAAVGVSIGNLVLAALSLRQANRAVGATWPKMAVELGRSLMITLASLAPPTAVVLEQGIDIRNVWPATLLAGFSGLAAWVLCLFALGHPLKHEILLGLSKLRAVRGLPSNQRG